MTETPTATELAAPELPHYIRRDAHNLAFASDNPAAPVVKRLLAHINRLESAVSRPAVVAAELRRIYAAHWSNNTCCGHLIAELRARADELDPPTSKDA